MSKITKEDIQFIIINLLILLLINLYSQNKILSHKNKILEEETVEQQQLIEEVNNVMEEWIEYSEYIEGVSE